MKNNIVFLFFCLCMISCNKDIKVFARMISVRDNDLVADSLYQNKESPSKPRKVELLYVVKNNTDKKIYLPINVSELDTVHSYLSVLLVNGKDTITPLYGISKVPYKSHILNPRDSMLIFVRLYQFEKWETKWCNADTYIADIVSMIRVNYHRSKGDLNKYSRNAKIEFETDYRKAIFYEELLGMPTYMCQ